MRSIPGLRAFNRGALSRRFQVAAFSQSTSVVSAEKNKSLASLPSNVQGSRFSNSGKRVAIFGAAGFVARYLVNELGKHGHTIVACTRGDDMEWRHLRPLVDVGKFAQCYFALDNEASIRQAMEGADIVVNLTGKNFETRHFFPWIINWSYENLHTKGAQTLARIAREENVKHFIQMSSVAVDGENPKEMSRWAATKKKGNEAVLKEFPGAVIVKSNIIYGEEDKFLNFIAGQIIMLPYVPLINQGRAKIQPIFVGDVAKALATIVENYNLCGETFSLNGPHTYSYKEIAEFVADEIWRTNINFIDLPDRVAKSIGSVLEYQPIPQYTADRFLLQKQDQIEGMGKPTDLSFADLAITPEELEKKGFNFLFKFRPGGHFSDPRAHRTSVQVD